ncbi:MAG TPA: sugar phosphate nucleotidyltransferase [Acidimicrobiales bacterium]|nr:sugar phosphate nucleotidyltransferase [Acidimicrobiales bacterium]
MSANGAGFGVVAGDDRTVLGTVTDAEARDALLALVDPSAAVKDVMTARLARRSRLPAELAVEKGRLVDVVVTPPAGPAPIAVVMAGGRGKRLRPITDKVPKPLLRIGNQTIIERIMRGLVAAGVEDIYVALNYKAKMFERKLGDGERVGANVRYLHEEQALGTAGALGLLPEKPKGPVLVTNADIITRLDYARLLEFHRRHGGWATIAAMEHVAHIPYGVLRTEKTLLVAQDEKPDIAVRVNAGMYVLEPKALARVKANEYLDMPVLLEQLLAKKRAVHVFPLIEKWIDSGTPEEFERVMIDFATGAEE